MPSNATAMWRFDGTAGQRLFLDALAVTGGMRWRLLDPQGGLTLGNTGANDVADIGLPMDGTYTLLVEGLYYWWGRSSYGLALQDKAPPVSVALTLGAATTATIPAAGKSVRYSLSLAAASRLLMDVGTNSSALRWSLTDSDGRVVADRRFDQTNGNLRSDDPLMAVAAGTYTLTVYATDDFAGDAQFRLIDTEAEATSLAFDDQVFGGLPLDGRGTQVFRLTGARHQSFAMDMINSPSSSMRWRLIGPAGNQVIPMRGFGDEGGFVLPEAGDYLLLVEGSIYDAPTTATYRFQLVTPAGIPATGATREEFGAGSSIPHVLTTHSGAIAGEEDAGGGNTVLRLLNPLSAGQRSSIAFGATAAGPYETYDASFDFTLSSPNTGGTGNGFAALLLRTSAWGSHGAVPAFGLETSQADVLGASIDLVQDGSDGPVPHLSLHFGGKLIERRLSDLGVNPIGKGRFTLSVARAAGGAEVTVRLDMGGGAVTVLDRHFVAGMELADRRLVIHAENGSANTAGLTIDDVTIATAAASTALIAQPGDVLSGNLTQSGAVDRWKVVLTEQNAPS